MDDEVLAARRRLRETCATMVEAIRQGLPLPLPEHVARVVKADMRTGQSQNDQAVTEEFIYALACEVHLQAEQLRCAFDLAMTGSQRVVPLDAKIQLLHEINATARGYIPAWWRRDQKAERFRELTNSAYQAIGTDAQARCRALIDVSELEDVRVLLEEACGELEDTGGEHARSVAADLRARAGVLDIVMPKPDGGTNGG